MSIPVDEIDPIHEDVAIAHEVEELFFDRTPTEELREIP